MSTTIEWTDVTDNIIAVEGGGWWCRKISPGCANCYAAKLNQNSFYGGNKLAYSGPVPKLILRSELIDSWQRQRISKKHFVASMTDVFGDWVSQEWVNRMLVGMLLAPKQIFQILTKRPDVAFDRITDFLQLAGADKLPDNIWIGTSVENQECADKRIPELLKIPSKIRFLSCEPLLGPVDISDFLWKSGCDPHCGDQCSQDADCPLEPREGHWVIAGGESGSHARPMQPDWARGLRDQCQGAKVPFLFKQWGDHAPHFNVGMGVVRATPEARASILSGEWLGSTDEVMVRTPKKSAGRLLDGREWNEFPTGKAGA